MKPIRAFIKQSSNKKGMTLIEVVIAMLILLVSVTAVSQVIVFTAKVSNFNREQLVANNIANAKMEEIKAMPFAQIGVQGGDPQGNIPREEVVNVDGKDYLLEININWEEMVDNPCIQNAEADWDVKLVRIVVTPFHRSQDEVLSIRAELEGLIARDSEQPLLIGSNIRICAFRGWDYETTETYTPVAGLQVRVHNNLVNRMIATTHRGGALFTGLASGLYQLEINPIGMIIRPGTDLTPIQLQQNTTAQRFILLEHPSQIELTLIEVLPDLSTRILANQNTTGSLAIEFPPTLGGGMITRNFNQTDDRGRPMGEPAFQGLWPHPMEQTGAYAFRTLNIQGYNLFAQGIWDTDRNQPWSGHFDGPNTTKNLNLYLFRETDFEQLPPPDYHGGNPSSWLQARSINVETIFGINNPGIPFNSSYFLQDGVFNRGKNNEAIAHTRNNSHVYFFGRRMFVRGDILTLSNGGTMHLFSNQHFFEGEIRTGSLNNFGTIILRTLRFDANNHLLGPNNQVYTVSRVNENQQTVQQPITVPRDAQTSILGRDIQIKGPDGFLGFSPSSPQYNTSYGIVEFQDNVYIGTGSSRVAVITKGVYLFPDGFNLRQDHNKTPEQGGLIKIGH